jgi:hypothetical protein
VSNFSQASDVMKKSLGQNGSGMIQILVVSVILMIVAMVMLSMFDSQRKVIAQKHSTATMEQLTMNVEGQVSSREAWENTIAANSGVQPAGLDCLNKTKNQTCSNATVSNIKIVSSVTDAAGNPVVAIDNSPTAGFTIRGEACSTFDAVNGNDDCPIHVNVSWTPVCTGANPCCGAKPGCAKPESDIAIQYTIQFKNNSRGIVINPLKWGVPPTDRTSFTTDAANTDCGLDAMVYIGKGATSPNSTYPTDPRGCVSACAFKPTCP